MRLVDKLIFKDLVGPFLNGMMMFLLLLFAAAYLFPATELLVKGVPFLIVGKLTLLSLPSVVTQTFPMAMLLGGLMAFGRLSGDREAVAVFAAGISFPRASRAVWIAGAIVSVFAFFWNDLVVPPTMTAYWNLRQSSVKKMMRSNQPMSYPINSPDGKQITETVTINGGFDAATQTLRRVTIVKYSQEKGQSGQPAAIIYCERAKAYDDRGLKWRYYDGYFTSSSVNPKTGKEEDSMRLDFADIATLPHNATVGKTFEEVLNVDVTDPSRKSFRQLRDEINADRAQGYDARGKEVDLYGKIALPLASLIFGIVGSALGLNTQRGGGKAVGFGMAIFIVFLYWVFYHSMFVVGKNGGLPPIVASFLADIVGAIAGLILAARASR